MTGQPSTGRVVTRPDHAFMPFPKVRHPFRLIVFPSSAEVRRGGAGRITAVLPYFGYARQDRRGRAGEAVGARVVADALAASGAQRLVVVDPHSAALEAMCGIPWRC